ncbi:MAG: D-alanine--D-alanine ligase family protein [Opitutaceae bacterium]
MARILKRGLKVLALFDLAEPTSLRQDFSEELKTEDWKTEAHVLSALRDLGCEVEYLAIHDNTDLLRQKLEVFPADVIFNLVEEFRNNRALDQAVVSFLELAGVPFTGCGSTGLTLCRHKGISKKILSYHRIRVPQFAVLAKGRRITRPRWLPFPILVKPLKEEASMGIAQASFVGNEEDFRERAAFVHEKLGHDVIAEEYIAGRELYVSVLGNQRLDVFPIRELLFKEVPPDEPRIATYKAKWDDVYRKRWGIESQFAQELAPEVTAAIARACRRIYHLLAMDGYGRIDLRLTPENEIVFIEANPNPFLAEGEDFALSAEAGGFDYARLIGRIVQLGIAAVRY